LEKGAEQDDSKAGVPQIHQLRSSRRGADAWPYKRSSEPDVDLSFVFPLKSGLKLKRSHVRNPRNTL
jgi:hypothetical protein